EFKSHGIIKSNVFIQTIANITTNDNIFQLHYYPIIGYRYDLKSITSTTYEEYPSKYITELEEFGYYENGLLESKSVSKSNSKQAITQYTYPHNLNEEPYISMASNGVNILTPIIQKRQSSSVNGISNETYKGLDKYVQNGDVYLKYQFEDSYKGSSTNIVFEVLSFDAYNNPQHLITKDGIQKSYQYGFEGMYPLVEVLNAEPDQFYYEGFEDTKVAGAKAGNGYNESLSFGINFDPPDAKQYVLEYWFLNGTDWEFIKKPYSGPVTLVNGPVDEIRIYPVDAQMTTFTYKPLVGVTSVNSANGTFTFYEYDGNNRLALVRSHTGEILKNYTYHLKQEK
ncbi:MAG: hypothetical protein AAF901_06140, partial [Bacteroidota bacterium]